mmetsp:Transcript_118406/g.331582  ORF Transcript_118406/g.331582 Transcript_118406/m.331582 type:complete len:88 (+) Transcript_118406:67-330(+)
MSRLGPLPPIGQKSECLPESLRATWEADFKAALSRGGEPTPFPDASLCELAKMKAQLESERGAEAQGQAPAGAEDSGAARATDEQAS